MECELHLTHFSYPFLTPTVLLNSFSENSVEQYVRSLSQLSSPKKKKGNANVKDANSLSCLGA